MDDPILSDSSETNKIGNQANADYFFVQLGKRLYAIAPLIAMSFSTINQVFSIAKSLAAQSSNDSYYDEYIEVKSNGQSSYFSCKYGDAQVVVTYCPYESVIAFQVMLALWVAYFAVFTFARVLASIFYATNDLRFYIAIDRYNGYVFNKVLVTLGGFLTLISMVVSLYYMTPDTEWNPNVDTPSLTALIIFLGINVASLSEMTKVTTCMIHNQKMELFQEPIILRNKGGVSSIVASVDSVIKPILVLCMISATENNDIQLSEHGDPKQLKDAVKKLYKSDH